MAKAGEVTLVSIVKVVVLCIASLGMGLGIALILFAKPKTSETLTTSPSVTSAQDQTKTISLSMMGDMLAHDSVVAQAKNGSSYNFKPYFDAVRSSFAADIVFCNPETPVAGDTLGISGYPTFNAPGAFASDLRSVGCNVLNLATNHMYDKGQTGIDTSIDVWSATKPLAAHGANKSESTREEPAYFTIKGVTFAFVAFADFSNTTLPNNWSVNLYHDSDFVKRILAKARANAQVVIVSAHWGTEDSTKVNADQTAAAKLFVDNGADIVIGTGPHVIQAFETLTASDGRAVPVWYSIGNMLSSQLQADELSGGIAKLSIEMKDGKAVVKSPVFTPTFMSYDWSTADRAAEKLDTRSNLRLQLLKNADSQIKAMFPGETTATRLDFVRKTLGTAVTVE